MTPAEYAAVLEALQGALERNVGSRLTSELGTGIYTMVAEQMRCMVKMPKQKKAEPPSSRPVSGLPRRPSKPKTSDASS